MANPFAFAAGTTRHGDDRLPGRGPIPADGRPRPICEGSLDDQPPTTRVVEAVAKASEVAPIGVSPRLSDALDPDALDRLFSPRGDGRSRTEGGARFEMGTWHVQVDRADDCVRVYEAADV